MTGQEVRRKRDNHYDRPGSVNIFVIFLFIGFFVAATFFLVFDMNTVNISNNNINNNINARKMKMNMNMSVYMNMNENMNVNANRSCPTSFQAARLFKIGQPALYVL